MKELGSAPQGSALPAAQPRPRTPRERTKAHWYVPTVNLTDTDRSNIKKQLISSKCQVFPAQLASEWGMCVATAKNFINLYQSN